MRNVYPIILGSLEDVRSWKEEAQLMVVHRSLTI